MAARKLLALSAGLAAAAAAPPKLVLHVIVDDLGYGDVPWHGANAEHVAPNMNALAMGGVRLERMMVASTCTPSRSSFLSGRLPVHVQTTLNNPEQPNAGVPRNMTSIAHKLKAAGWATHVVGKWDLGMATPDHTPYGRGFDSSLIYYEHKVDYWTQVLFQSACQAYDDGDIVDLWQHNASSRPAGGIVGGPARGWNGTQYIEFTFRDRVLDIISRIDPASNASTFVYWTPHVAHCPLQVPDSYLARFNYPDDEALCQAQTPYIFPGSAGSDYRCRSQYAAMVYLLDEEIGNVTAALKAKGLWADTLMVLHSDNGGPVVLAESGASNWPLRGGKYSDFEGGVRVAGFMAGGYVPPALRGTTQEGMVHVADWLATYCGLAGLNASFCTADALAAASGLPPIDSLDQWPLLSGANTTSPRTELPLGPNGFISGQWKLLLGQQGSAGWQGPTFPNASSGANPPDDMELKCGTAGCLFNVADDPTEQSDVAAQHPDVVAALKARLAQLAAGFFTNNDTGTNVPECASRPNKQQPCACYLALPGNKWDGFFGPYQV